MKARILTTNINLDEGTCSLDLLEVGDRSRALALELDMPEGAHIEIDENGLSRCIRGKLVHEPDIGRVEFPFPQRLARGELRSLVIAPLLAESRVFGVLIAARRTPHNFTSGECERLARHCNWTSPSTSSSRTLACHTWTAAKWPHRSEKLLRARPSFSSPVGANASSTRTICRRQFIACWQNLPG
jgi:hypothetical protein